MSDSIQSRPLVVINADDFGMSVPVNAGINASFASGLISTSTMLVTGAHFRDAAAWVRENHLEANVGLHLNLSDGGPLTAAIRNLPGICDDNGNFHPRGRARWRLDMQEAAAIYSEWNEQVDVMLREGLTPSHLDSHHHVHTQWPLATIAIELAHARGIAAVRLSRNCGVPSTFHAAFYKSALNHRIRRAGLATVRTFAAASHTCTADHAEGPIELMVHPSLSTDGRIIDVPGDSSLEAVTARWIALGTLVPYRSLKPIM